MSWAFVWALSFFLQKPRKNETINSPAKKNKPFSEIKYKPSILPIPPPIASICRLIFQNLEIIKGSTIGFKGASGSGKSTLIDLFVTLLKPSKGEILVDGVNIFKNINSWRNIIGYVSQFVFLSDTSISENIAFGKTKKDIDYKQLDKVIKIAQLSNFIKKLPNGIETKVGENGVQLSGGQKQRIGIARALYDEPDILVFDEATSSLDTSTEIEVMKAIYSLKGKKTIIIVAHRLSTLDQCDYIYKVESGELILD